MKKIAIRKTKEEVTDTARQPNMINKHDQQNNPKKGLHAQKYMLF